MSLRFRKKIQKVSWQIKNTMRIKWLIWGLILFIISGFGWFIFVILSVITLGKFRIAANIFGIISALSLPISIVLAIFDRKKIK